MQGGPCLNLSHPGYGTTGYLPFRILNETGAPAVMVGSEMEEHEQLDDDTDKTGGGLGQRIVALGREG